MYEIATDDHVRLNEESVAIKRFTRGELKEALAKTPERFGDAFYFVLENFYPDYLPSDYTTRWT